MANRYGAITGSKKISEDWNNINLAFDKVQADVDAKAATVNSHIANADIHVTKADKTKWDGHVANADIHVTAAQKAAWDAKADGSTSTELAAHIADQEVHVTQADHDKLGSIETGAQVNQNAFAKVNDIEAADPSSQFYIVGGIGITVTTNPNTGEITVTATGSAAPGAHGITHTEHGADPIPTATLTEGGLLSAAQLAEIITHGEMLDEHAAAITDLEDRLDAAEVVQVTLQPGLQVVTAAKDARFQLGEIRGKTEVNGQGRIGLIGVENPYAIATSGNMLPPFYEWVALSLPAGVTYTIDEPYRMTLNDPGQQVGAVSLFYTLINVPKNTDITLNLPNNTWNTISDANGDNLFYSWEKSTGRTINTGSNNQIRIYLGNRDGSGVYTFINPTLTIGTEPKPFQPQQKAMLALQTELHANPTDGTDPDVLFQQDGQYSKLTKWKKVELDGTLSWSFSGSFSGYKNVRIPLTEGVVGSGYATKYDGIGLTNRGGVSSDPTAADQFNIFSNGYLYLTVANANSGWGDAYTPTADEIKAYFWGWTMCNQDGSVPWSGGTKYWKTVGKTGVADTATLPTSQAPNRALYNLLYRLAKETVGPVVSEGCLSLAEEDNMVEVGTGIVLRESAVPVKIGSYYVFNSMQSGYTNNPLKFKVDMFLAIYNKNREVIPAEFNNTFFPYGRYRATIFDWQYTPESIYSVTYLKLDKSPVVPITGSLAANEKAQLTDLTAGVAEALQRVSVVEQKKAEKDAPGWIESPLLNGWARHSAENPTFRYYKDASGRVNFEAVIRSGAVVTGTQIASMPDGYKPDIMQKIKCYSANGSANASGLIEFTTDGLVRIGTSGNGTYYNAILIFRGSYLAKE